MTQACRTQAARVLALRRIGVQPGLVSGFDAASLSRETVPEYATRRRQSACP